MLPVLQEGCGPEAHEDAKEHSSQMVKEIAHLQRRERGRTAEGTLPSQQLGPRCWVPNTYPFPCSLPWLTLATGQISEIFHVAQVSQSEHTRKELLLAQISSL